MAAENTDLTHYGRPNGVETGEPTIPSLEVSGTMYYVINTGGQNDYSHVNISFETSGASGVTTQNIQNASPSAWNYTGLEPGNRYKATISPVDVTGNIGDPILWTWVVSAAPIVITWTDFTFDTNWDVYEMSWSVTGTTWTGAANSGFYFFVGTSGNIHWAENYKATKLRFTFTGVITAINVTTSTGGVFSSIVNPISGTDYDLNWSGITGDIRRIEVLTGGTEDVVIDIIELGI